MEEPDIDYTLFDPKKIKKDIAAILNQPKLDRYQILLNEQALAVVMARLDQTWEIFLPLSEEYIKIRRRADNNYAPENDKVLDKLRDKIFPSTGSMLDQMDKYHDISMRVSAARTARFRLLRLFEQVSRMMDLTKASMEIERSAYMPDSVDTGGH